MYIKSTGLDTLDTQQHLTNVLYCTFKHRSRHSRHAMNVLYCTFKQRVSTLLTCNLTNTFNCNTYYCSRTSRFLCGREAWMFWAQQKFAWLYGPKTLDFSDQYEASSSLEVSHPCPSFSQSSLFLPYRIDYKQIKQFKHVLLVRKPRTVTFHA